MLSLYKRLVLSRLLYALPLLSIATPRREALGTFHRVALSVCLGASHFVRNTAVLLDAEDSPFQLQFEARAVGHIGRLQGTRSSSSLFENLLSHLQSDIGLFTRRFRSDIEFPKRPVLPLPFRQPLHVHVALPDLGTKFHFDACHTAACG